jgi:hypothetical protein
MQRGEGSRTFDSVMATILAGMIAMAGALVIVAIGSSISPREAAANPAMAQKTGQPCGKCHTAKPPELNAYGKSYKAKGR